MNRKLKCVENGPNMRYELMDGGEGVAEICYEEPRFMMGVFGHIFVFVYLELLISPLMRPEGYSILLKPDPTKMQYYIASNSTYYK